MRSFLYATENLMAIVDLRLYKAKSRGIYSKQSKMLDALSIAFSPDAIEIVQKMIIK